MESKKSQILKIKSTRAKVEKILDSKAINLSIAVKDALDNYLVLVKQEISKYSPKTTTDKAKMLYYSKMKRFIFTAYNNLYEMDSKFFDNNLKKLRRDLLGLERVNEELISKSSNVAMAYEMIFLNQQEEFKLLESYLKQERVKLSAMETSERALKKNLEVKEKQLAKLSKGTPKYREFLEETKKLRRQYADLTYEFYNLKDEFITLNRVKNEFQKEYFLEFVEIFKKSIEQIKSALLNVLNYKAYELDYDLWSKARDSEIIRKFFKMAKIDGGFSSKTYLKYYLQNLDSTKTSELQRELMDILSYLRKITEKNILVTLQRESRVEHFKYLLELIDKDFVVKTFTRPFSALTISHQIDFDLIILEDIMVDMDAMEFIQTYIKESPKESINTKFAIFTDREKFFKKSLKELNLSYITLNQNISDSDFEMTIYKFLKGEQK